MGIGLLIQVGEVFVPFSEGTTTIMSLRTDPHTRPITISRRDEPGIALQARLVSTWPEKVRPLSQADKEWQAKYNEGAHTNCN